VGVIVRARRERPEFNTTWGRKAEQGRRAPSVRRRTTPGTEGSDVKSPNSLGHAQSPRPSGAPTCPSSFSTTLGSVRVPRGGRTLGSNHLNCPFREGRSDYMLHECHTARWWAQCSPVRQTSAICADRNFGSWHCTWDCILTIS